VVSVYLNHLLIFVDQDTYASLAACSFLNGAFAPSERRQTIDEANSAHWTGHYFYGNCTYFEFMEPGATTWRPIDGVAFGVDEEGSGPIVCKQLGDTTGLEIMSYLRTRQDKDGDIPWFDMIEYSRPDTTGLISWVMAYDARFLERWEPQLPPASAGCRRKDVLDRYRARLGWNGKSALFGDITELTVALVEEQGALFRRELSAYGYRISETTTGYSANGPDISIHVDTSTSENKVGIQQFTLALNRPKSGAGVYRYGSSCELSFKDDLTAVWKFF
jgi:hypothetical protein